MENNQDKIIRERVEKIEQLVLRLDSHEEAYEAAMLSQAVLNDTVGGAHPLMASIKNALEKPSINQAHAASKALVKLFKEGGLVSPRLLIAHEIESDLLDLAQSQVESSEKTTDNLQKQIYLAIASFLCGAALEDALRRLCDNRGIQYDTQHTSISKLQSNLYLIPAFKSNRNNFSIRKQTNYCMGRHTKQSRPRKIFRNYTNRSIDNGNWSSCFH